MEKIHTIHKLLSNKKLIKIIMKIIMAFCNIQLKKIRRNFFHNIYYIFIQKYTKKYCIIYLKIQISPKDTITFFLKNQ